MRLLNLCKVITGWRLVVFFIFTLVLIPVSVVISALFLPGGDVWRHLVETTLSGLLVNTFWLALGVVIGTSVLGVSLAWFTSVCEFPGRRFFSWILLLPFAIPAYVTAFVMLGIFDFTGPIQTTLRDWLDSDLSWFPDIRGRLGVITVMTLAFYPYVYLLARNAFYTQGKRSLEAAQTLGLNCRQGFFYVTLPLARPWIAGGVMLALMETLADFGTVAIFNYDTFTTAIYKAWFSLFSLPAASQLASILVLIVFILLLLEQHYRAQIRYAEIKRSQPAGRIKLSGWRAWAVVGYISAVLFFAFLLPVTQLFFWVVQTLSTGLDHRYLEFLWHSLLLSGFATILICVVVVLLVYASRRHQDIFTRIAIRISTLGYALPGTVLAVGIFVPVIWLDTHLNEWIRIFWRMDSEIIIQGTLVTMLIAYMVRFLAVGHFPVDSAMHRITQSIDEAAQGLGLKGLTVLHKIHLPVLKSGIFTAATLIFVDVMKEMPITLMTRPFGWDTLAVRIYEMTSEGEWEQAAIPAMTLVLIGMIPIIFFLRQTEKPIND